MRMVSELEAKEPEEVTSPVYKYEAKYLHLKINATTSYPFPKPPNIKQMIEGWEV